MSVTVGLAKKGLKWLTGHNDRNRETEEKTKHTNAKACSHGASDDSTAPTIKTPATKDEPCAECKAEKRAMRKYRFKIILGLILPYALSALDTTIIASALPTIGAQFDRIRELNWIVSAFNLTSAAFIPCFAQLADALGRHTALQLSILLMMVGSAICTASPVTAFGALLLGRALQGVGCAGISVVVQVIIADKVSLQDKATNWTVFSLVGGLAYAVGPIVGGYLSEVHWRWCFAINLPVGAAAVPLVFFVLRPELLGPQPLSELRSRHGATGEQQPGVDIPLQQQQGDDQTTVAQKLSTIDIGGQALFLLGFGLLILGLTWGGATYGWASPAVLTSLIAGAAISAAWLGYEYLVSTPGTALQRRLWFQRPMIPWELCKDRNISLLFYINFATGMAMYSVLYFVEIYFSMVKHLPPSEAGLLLLYYIPGLGGGIYISMFLCNRWPRQTFHPLFLGSIFEAVGVGMMAYALYFGQEPVIYAMTAIAGVGTGLRFMPGTLHSVGFFPQHVAAVVATMDLGTSFGGTVALTIMQAVLNNASGIPRDSPYWNSASKIESLPADVAADVTNKAKNGITWAFVSLVPFMVVCVLASACLGNVHITDSEEAGAGANEEHLTRGSYPLSLLTDRRRQPRPQEGPEGGRGGGASADLEAR